MALRGRCGQSLVLPPITCGVAAITAAGATTGVATDGAATGVATDGAVMIVIVIGC